MAFSASFNDYVERLEMHPQLLAIAAAEEQATYQAKGELGLPDPMIIFGVDNVPISDPAFDRFLPTSKVIGFNQDIPNPSIRNAKSERYTQISKKQSLIHQYTRNRLEFMLISKMAEYQSVASQTDYIKQQISLFNELENTLKGELESGTSIYQRFSEIDVEKAEAERKLNDLMAQKTDLEAEFVRLIDEVPDIQIPEPVKLDWKNEVEALYPVQIAKQDTMITQKDVDVADAAFKPNYGVNALYKQRESGENGMYEGDDWFSVQARISVPLWSSSNQTPKLAAAKANERRAQYAYDDAQSLWKQKMISLQSRQDATKKNISILKDKISAMGEKIKASEHNYEAGTQKLDAVLFAKIDRLNIKSQLAKLQSTYTTIVADLNSHIIH